MKIPTLVTVPSPGKRGRRLSARVRANGQSRPTEPLAETSVVAEVAKLDCLARTARATLARHFEGHGVNDYIL